MRIAIREAGEADAPLLYDLYSAIGAKPHDYFERCLREEYVIYIAALDGTDCGFGILNFKSRYSPFQRLGIPEIQDLNVVPGARQKGVATAIIARCEDHARRQGCGQTGIAVGLSADYGPAQRLYVKLGYVPDGAGATYDHLPANPRKGYPLDDDLCLMLLKRL